MFSPTSRASRFALVLLASAACFVSPSGVASAQERSDVRKTDAQAYYAPDEPLSCESFAAYVDDSLIEWQNTGAETYFIIVVRPGARERAGLGRTRLRDIEAYLKQRPRASERHVLAEGARTEGPGRVEIYVAGRLRASIPVRKNDRHVCSGKVNPFL